MNADYTKASSAIQALTNELAGRRMQLAHRIPETHHGKKYEDIIGRFVAHANKLEREYRNRIWETSAMVGSLADVPVDDINRLWHRLARAITNVSEHPTKPVATLIIDGDNKMQAFGVNCVPPNIKKNPHHYIVGERKNFIVCSERMSIANLLKYKITPYKTKKAMREEITRQQIAHFSRQLKLFGEHTTEMHGSKMISTVTPCLACADVITAYRPKAVYSGSAGSHFTRQNSFAPAQFRLTESGIKVWQLVS